MTDAKMLGEESVRPFLVVLPRDLTVHELERAVSEHLRRHTDPHGKHFRLPRVQEQGRFDREVGPLPDVLVDDYGADVPTLLRPILDMVSQAAGYDGSPLFDHDGN